MVSLNNKYGIAKSKALVSLMMFCHLKLKLYVLYVLLNYFNTVRELNHNPLLIVKKSTTLNELQIRRSINVATSLSKANIGQSKIVKYYLLGDRLCC